ncbi:MAG: InlB B-repeat-containing protein, partial [Solobacterium sp.]|nr:InlB B-repeat-containing protein [Solobacterium sp.]
NKFAMQIVEPNSANLQTIVVTPNSGYRLYGWYKSIADSTYVGGHEYYDAIFAQGNVVSQDTGYAFSPVEDKDLYVARMQASVTFHDYQGNVIDRSGANESETNDNYYFYKEQLPTFEPGNKPVDTNEKFIGWTTVEGTHLSITSNELEGYKANGQFYEAGDEITTTLQLYPVYASLISNIHLIYEGNELDAVNDVTLREGYGRAFASIDENNVATISITKEYSDPTHYRFLGWYEDGHRISREESFVLEGVDLTQEHTYTARFEYLVDYYVKDQYTNSGSYSYKNGALYQSVWHTYGEDMQQIAAPNFISSTFEGWVLDGYQGTQSAVGYIVTKADDKAYSKVSNASDSGYTISCTTDFPNSATIDKSKSGARITLTVQENPNYHLQFWTRDDWGLVTGIDHTLGKDNPYVHNYGTGFSYQFRARMLADATFHQYDGSSTNVLRGYQENVLQDGNGVREYHYLMDDKLIDNSAITTLGGEVNISASPSALGRSGYYFVGWIDKDSLSEEEIAYVFDIDEYTSSSLEKAKPYVLNTDDLVEKAMPNIYAIYVPYSILTTTNIKEVGVRAPQNLPSDPTYVGLDDTQESSTLSFMIPDGSEYVIGNSGETYRLTKFTVRINGGEEERIESPYTYTVKVGNQYVFMAYYEPLVVNFHINAIDTITFIRNNGQSINRTNETMPEPQFDIASTIAADTGYTYLFVGYTEEESPTIYHRLDSATEIDTLMLVKGGTIVTHSMDLYPVYAPISISLQSNIDGQLSASGYNPSVIRYMVNRGNDEVELVATSVQGYTFKGWYSQYTNDTNPGTLLSTDSNMVLDKESAFEGAIYTAVYEPTITVNFHGTDEMRSVIYSTSFPIGSRSFVTESTQFENGEGELITIEGSPIDGEAFERILVQLSSSQYFVEWVYQDGEGNIHRWNEFSTNAISTNMDLYPSVVEMSAYEVPTDLEGTRIFEEATDILNLSLERNIAGSETTYTCKANFKDEYYRIQGDVAGNNRNQLVPTIGIHLVEGIYVNEKIENILANSTVALYAQSEGNLIEEKIVDAEGNAIFPLFGTINVTTHATDIEDDFLYTVVRNDDASALETVRFSLRDGETKQIYVPYGQYTIKQDNEYSWRYSDQQEVSGLVVSNLRNANAEFHNEKANLKWFDHSERRINKYEN